jgi:hypothetical protein
MFPARRRRALAAAAALSLAAAAVIAGTATVAAAAAPPYTVLGSTQKVLPTESVSGSSAANLVGAQGEFVSFQVVISGPETAASVSTGAQLADGAGHTIPNGNVTIYREDYFETKTASAVGRAVGRWPDVLIPTVDTLYHEARNAFPTRVPAGENRVAWVDILVPPTQAAGSYDGNLRASGAGGAVVVPVHLEVQPFALPPTSSLKSMFLATWNNACPALGLTCAWSADPRTMELGWRTNADVARLFLDDRITIVNPHWTPPTDSTELNFFNQYVLPLINGTAGTRLAGAKLTTYLPDTVNDDQTRAWKSVAAADGFTPKAVLYRADGKVAGCDELGNTTRWDICAGEVNHVHDIWPGIPNVITNSIQNVQARDPNFALTDRLVTEIEQLDGTGHRQFGDGVNYDGNQRPKYNDFLSRAGKSLWIYTACGSSGCDDPGTDPYYNGWPDYTIDTAASQNRAMGWMAYKYDASGELYFQVEQQMGAAWIDQSYKGDNGDGTLIYPGTTDRIGGADPIPLESIRMKEIRNGYQDYEYLKLATDRGHGAEARQIADSVYPTMHDAQFTDGNARIDGARRQLANLIAGRTAGQLTVTTPLAFSPATPAAGSPVTATYTVTNTGGAPVHVDYLMVGVRDASNGHHDIGTTPPLTLQPGQPYTFSMSTAFTAPGTYTAWPASFDGTGWTHLAGNSTLTVH